MACRVMGIVNVTPDSFSDGGRYFRPEEAIRRAENLIAEGADIIDLGGESTRPGATPLDWQAEWERLEPVLRGLSPSVRGAVPVSVDTYHPETARRAVAAGCSIINCVAAEAVAGMLEILRENGEIELVLPFRGGACPRGGRPDLVPEEAWGLSPAEMARVYLDPMVGFGTTREEDLALLCSIPRLAKLGRVLVGASRKRIVRKLVGEPPSARLRKMWNQTGKGVGGNVAVAVWAALHGASAVRVHEVRDTVQALRVAEALEAGLGA